MISRFAKFTVCLFCSIAAFTGTASTGQPKHEMRAVWMSPLAIDWPQKRNLDTSAHQQEAIGYLDYLQTLGINCIFLHVRQMADRIYMTTTYGDITIDEPFSEYVTGQRGKEPGYDPLEFWINECHNRGMELFAWINPYRFCNYESTYAPDASTNPRKGQSEFDERMWENGQIISHTIKENDTKYITYYIFNPALQQTTNRIIDICRLITASYDIDGIVFDDWFYPNGISSQGTTAGDYHDYENYLLSGGNLNIGDWRRENINKMISSVNNAIKDTKPWVRFGISPAGAAGKGIKDYDNLPELSQFCQADDWQYDGIYADPIAWLRNKSIDFISPQLYWKTDHETNPFEPLAQWWNIVSGYFGCHCYISHSLSLLAPDTDAVGNITKINNTPENRQEISNQIAITRKIATDSGNASGSILFSAKNIDGAAQKGVGETIKDDNYLLPALPPVMSWFAENSPPEITGLTRNGAVLTWDSIDNMRYTVYALPDSINENLFNKEVKYLVGMTYCNTFSLPDNKLSGYKYAVAPYDRYGDEHNAVFICRAAETLPSPTLKFPDNNSTEEIPFDFSWETGSDVTCSIIEIARDEKMTDIIYSKATTERQYAAANFNNIPLDTTLYWRVRACAANRNDGISQTRQITVREMRITSPTDNATGVSLTPTIFWTLPERTAVLQISTSEDFNSGSLTLSIDVSNGEYTIPRYTLCVYTTYFIRLKYSIDGETETVSRTIQFTTEEITPESPVFAKPVNGGDLHGNEYISLVPLDGIKGLRIEVSHTATFPSRTSYITEDIATSTWCDAKSASEMTINKGKPVDGELYYARARATYNSPIGTRYTDYSAPISFFYRSEDSGINSITADNQTVTITITDISGRHIGVYTCLTSNYESLIPDWCPAGIYIFHITSKNGAINARKIIKHL